MSVAVRPATDEDLPPLTEIRNYYIVHTPVSFDVKAYTLEDAAVWFGERADGRRYRTMVACGDEGSVVGFACTGRFRPKAAYDTTVEVSIACRPEAVGRGVGSALYGTLLEAISGEDIHRLVAAITQPNPASNGLHERFGFRPIGVLSEVGRKFGRYWDVLWMERPLV